MAAGIKGLSVSIQRPAKLLENDNESRVLR